MKTAINRTISLITLVVRDYDEAIAFFTKSLGFTLKEDTPLADGKRWVVVEPSGLTGAALLLAEAANSEQQTYIGNQTGGRVFLFLHTEDFWADYNRMQSNGVQFIEQPRKEEYGMVVVFMDLYGNKWDLIQPNNP